MISSLSARFLQQIPDLFSKEKHPVSVAITELAIQILFTFGMVYLTAYLMPLSIKAALLPPTACGAAFVSAHLFLEP